MNWAQQTVVVTGAGGFIGSHLTERLVRLGARTRAFVHYNSAGSWGWLDRSELRNEIEVILGDIQDRDGLEQAARGATRIFHPALHLFPVLTRLWNGEAHTVESGFVIRHTDAIPRPRHLRVKADMSPELSSCLRAQGCRALY